jgi:hypothetical protein
MKRTVNTFESQADLLTTPALGNSELPPIRTCLVEKGDIGWINRERIVDIGVKWAAITLELPHARDLDVVPA